MAVGVEAQIAAEGDVAPYEKRWWALAVLGLGLILIGLDNTILNVALPTLVKELGATNSQLQWMVDSYVLVFAGLLLTAGSLGDRFGRKGAFNTGLILFVSASIYCATTDTATQLIVGRALMGIGGAFIMPSTLSILTNMFPAHERPRAIGIWAGMAGVGIPLGPLAGGWLLGHFAWGSVFLVNVPLVVIALVAGQVLLPTSRDPKAPRVDWGGAVLSVLGLGALIYALIEAPLHGWTSTSTLSVLAIAVAILSVFALYESRIKQPMLDMRFFKNPRFTAASIATTLVFFALMGALFSMTQYMQFVMGYSPLESGVRLTPMALGMMIGAPVSARMVEHIGAKLVVTGGLVVVALGMFLMSFLTAESSYPQFLGSLMVMALGMGFTMAPATEAIMGAIPRSKAGVGSAMNDTTRQVGAALGVATIGSLMSSTYRSNIADALVGLPAEAIELAKDSVGAALAIAAQQPDGAALTAAADAAFVDAMGIGLIAGAIVALGGALIALAWLPAHGTEAGESFDDEPDAVADAPMPVEVAGG